MMSSELPDKFMGKWKRSKVRGWESDDDTNQGGIATHDSLTVIAFNSKWIVDVLPSSAPVKTEEGEGNEQHKSVFEKKRKAEHGKLDRIEMALKKAKNKHVGKLSWTSCYEAVQTCLDLPLDVLSIFLPGWHHRMIKRDEKRGFDFCSRWVTKVGTWFSSQDTKSPGYPTLLALTPMCYQQGPKEP